MEKVIYNITKPLKLEHIRSKKIYTFNELTKLLKYNDESFVVIGEQNKLLKE